MIVKKIIEKLEETQEFKSFMEESSEESPEESHGDSQKGSNKESSKEVSKESPKEGNEDRGEVFLAHVMVLIETNVEHKYDIGYYDKNKEKMATFLVDKDLSSVEVKKDQKIFKDPAHEIKPLDKDKIKFSYEKALKKAQEVQKEKYPQHIPIKEVVLLQNIKQGQVWNITYMTKNFKTLNIKIDSEEGKVVEDKLVELFSFG